MKAKSVPHEAPDAPKIAPDADKSAFVVVSRELWQKSGQNPGEAEVLKDKLLRTQAEWDNYRKRTIKEKEEALKYASEAILEKLLPIVDNFEMGLAAAQNAKDPSAVVEGLSMVLTNFRNLLREEGVETIDAQGKAFDPHLHEALGQIETADEPEGTVVQQMRKGYKLKDRLLRAATVFVAKKP